MADMEDFLFGSDLEDSDDESKAASKTNKESEREAQLNELFGDSPSEGEDELEHAASDEEESGGETQNEVGNKTSIQEYEEEEDESEVKFEEDNPLKIRIPVTLQLNF